MEVCAICLEETDEKISKCEHTFHHECIEEWYMKSNTIKCPLCREPNIQGYEILKKIWFKSAIDQLVFIKISLIKTFEVDKDYLIISSIIPFDVKFKENLDNAIYRVIGLIYNSIVWIKYYIKLNVRLTRSRLKCLDRGVSLLKSRLHILSITKHHEEARYFSIACQYFERWGVETKIWTRHSIR